MLIGAVALKWPPRLEATAAPWPLSSTSSLGRLKVADLGSQGMERSVPAAAWPAIIKASVDAPAHVHEICPAQCYRARR